MKIVVEDHIRRNKRYTIYLCLLMALLFIGVIVAIGYLLFDSILISFLFAVPVAAVYILITYSFSVSTVIKAAGAIQANPQIREEKLLIYRVEEISIAAGLPAPKVYVQKSDYINAFATGRNPEESVICVTTGALKKLNQEELEGVIAHEMSHIKNYDIRVATVTIGVVGAVSLLSEIMLRYLRFGRDRRKEDILLLVVAILFAMLAPLFTRLTYLAISRKREYLADSSGAYLTRNPEGLAKALEKIKNDHPGEKPPGSKTVAPLYISNPFRNLNKDSIFSTHPPIDERIRRLRSM